MDLFLLDRSVKSHEVDVRSSSLCPAFHAGRSNSRSRTPPPPPPPPRSRPPLPGAGAVCSALRAPTTRRPSASTSAQGGAGSRVPGEARAPTWPCARCGREIAARDALLHRRRHAALAALDLPGPGDGGPRAVAARRQLLVSRLQAAALLSEPALRGLNRACELLRAAPAPAACRPVDPLRSGCARRPPLRHPLVRGLAVCADRNAAWRGAMDDAAAVLGDFGRQAHVCFLGLCGGHGGAAAARLAAAELPALLLQQLARRDRAVRPTPAQRRAAAAFRPVFPAAYAAREERFAAARRPCEHAAVHRALAAAFCRMDRLLRLGRGEASRALWSGCSVAACVLQAHVTSPAAPRGGTASAARDSQRAPRSLSGVLHVANAGNVQAVLCRNGKGFCLTKEHTTQNVNERRRVLQNGAVISSNETHGLLEGHIKTTRGLGFHGDLKLKKLIIPAPQTISVPIDDLCQFLILATNGLWEVLDKEEVTALAITLFQMYRETCDSVPQSKAPSATGPLYRTTSDTRTTESENNIHILFQYRPESKGLSTTDLKSLSDSEYSMQDSKNVAAFPLQMTHRENCSKNKTDRPTCVDSVQVSEKASWTTKFFEDAAEYVSRELVNTALEAGSRDNITVMVVFLNGSEYQLLT
ncbi:protein phosphatase 2C-like domain-containing protein 1 [Ctenodactylus gundi]